MTLGVFLLRAAKDPVANANLASFTIWSSIVHAPLIILPQKHSMEKREFSSFHRVLIKINTNTCPG